MFRSNANKLKALATTCIAAATLALAGVANAEMMTVSNLGSYSSLNLRTAPTTQASVITRMPSGASNVDWTGNQVVNSSTLWYEVNYNGTLGWAAARYLEPTNTYNAGYPTYTGTYQPATPSNEYVPQYDYGTTPYVATPTYNGGYATHAPATSVNGVSSQDVGQVLFGLVVGGILGAALSGGDDGHHSGPTVVTRPPVFNPQPTPAPQPTPQPPARRGLSCQSANGQVDLRVNNANGNVRLTIGNRTSVGHASERRGGNRSFVRTINTGRGHGVLTVENIRAGGNNATLVWTNNNGRQRFYNMRCERGAI